MSCPPSLHQPYYKSPPLFFSKRSPIKEWFNVSYLFCFFCLSLEYWLLHFFIINTLNIEENSVLNGQNIIWNPSQCKNLIYNFKKTKTGKEWLFNKWLRPQVKDKKAKNSSQLTKNQIKKKKIQMSRKHGGEKKLSSHCWSQSQKHQETSIHTSLFNLILKAARAMIQVLQMWGYWERQVVELTYLLGLMCFNILHNRNGKGKLFLSRCLKWLINLYFPFYKKTDRPSPPMICHKARHVTDTHSLGRWALISKTELLLRQLIVISFFNYLSSFKFPR